MVELPPTDPPFGGVVARLATDSTPSRRSIAYPPSLARPM